MKTLKLVMFILYKYYSKGGTREIPYFSALCAVVMLIYIHVFQILILFDQVNVVLPMKEDDERPIKYLKLALFLLPIFFIVSLLVRAKDLKNASYQEEKVRKGGVYLIIYSVTSFLLLFVFAFLKR